MHSLFLRLGDSAIAVPVALVVALALALQRQWGRASWWLFAFGLAALAVLAGKLAFALSGWSYPSIGMYVISGHAMLTAAVYPMLLGTLTRSSSSGLQALGLMAGLGVTAVMGVVLVWGQYHTVAETVSGTLLGLGAACAGLRGPPSFRMRPVAVVAGAALACLAILDLPSAAHAAKRELWDRVANRIDRPDQYIRYFQHDPATGKHEVVVMPPKTRSAGCGAHRREATSPASAVFGAGGPAKTCN